MEKINIQMAMLAKEADGNIIGESFITRPDKSLASKLGVMFGVIEIYNAGSAFIDGFMEAITDLKDEYFLPPHNLEHGVEKRFEAAIARANRRIHTAISQSIEEIDLRNISAVIGLSIGNQVYLVSTGRVQGLFLRRKKNQELLILDILSGNGEKRFKPEPDKMFANILSGELSPADGLLLINEEFLSLFSQTELTETVLDNDPEDAVRLINKSLQDKVAKKNFYAVVIKPEDPTPTAEEKIKAMAPATAAKPVITPINSTLAAKQPITAESPPALRPKSTPPQQSIDNLLYTQVRTEKYLTPSLMPNWQKLLLIGWGGIKKYSANTGQWLIGVIKKLPKSKKIKPIELPVELIDNQQFFKEDELIVNTLHDEIKLPLNKQPINLTDKINNYLNSQIIKFLKLKRGQKIVLVLGLILLFLFSQSVVLIGRSNDNATVHLSNNDKLISQINSALSNAEAQNIFSDEAGALSALKRAKELLAQIPEKFAGIETNKQLKADLQAKINKTAQTLQKINYIENPAIVADFSTGNIGDFIGLAKTGSIFWTYNNLDFSFYRLDPATSKTEARTSTPIVAKKISAIDDKNLIVLSKDNFYYKYEIAKKLVTKIKPGRDWFLIKTAPPASLLIDPPLASSTINMSVIIDTNSYYLDANNQRIVIVDKAGIIKEQFTSPKLSGADSFAVDAKNKKLFVFNSGKVYQFDLGF